MVTVESVRPFITRLIKFLKLEFLHNDVSSETSSGEGAYAGSEVIATLNIRWLYVGHTAWAYYFNT